MEYVNFIEDALILLGYGDGAQCGRGRTLSLNQMMVT